MSFLEDVMTTRWDMYHTGGTVRAAQGIDVWIREITTFSKSTQGSTWHRRTLSLLCMSYQLKSCLARDMMDYNQAHLAFRKAYTIAKELNDPELLGSALAREGVTFIQQEAPLEATKYLRGALNNINQSGLPNLRGYTLQALSEAYAKSQQSNECWQSVRLAERILERPRDSLEQSRSRFSTASILAQKGVNAVLLHDYERAISLIEKSLISYDPTFIRGRARLTAQKAEAYQGLGLIDECAITAEEALNLAKSVGSNKTTARINALYSSLVQTPWRKEPGIARLGALLR
jgi:tetratricopeptide (TPR) repeat protein